TPGAAANGTGSAQAGWQPADRVHRGAVQAYLEMEVRAGRGAGAAHPADQLAAAHLLPDADQDPRLVPVTGGQPLALVRAVVDAREVAVPAVPPGSDHLAVG